MTTRDLAYTAVFAALLIVFAFVSIPVGAAGVPIVLQNAMVILTALILGPRRAVLAVTLFLGLGVVGLPVLAGGRSTLAALAGPTAGYIVGYVVSAAVAGWIAYRFPRPAGFVLAAAIGLAVQYLLGAVGLMARSDLSLGSAATAQIPFLIPDAVKLAGAVAIATGVHAAIPDLKK